MSGKGDPWDNAVMESFFGTLKTELIHHRHYKTRDEARRDIFEYIEIFYNRVRLHSTLGYLSPNAVRSKGYAKSRMRNCPKKRVKVTLTWTLNAAL